MKNKEILHAPQIKKSIIKDDHTSPTSIQLSDQVSLTTCLDNMGSFEIPRYICI